MDKKDQKKWVEGEWSEVQSEGDNERPKRIEQDSAQVVILPKEHQRFYDRLRMKVEDFLRKQTGGRMESAAKYILLAPDLFVLLARLMQDKRVKTKPKAIAGLAVAYFLSPIDFLPEVFAGPIGFLDDIVLGAYAISKILQDVDESILLEHWSGTVDLLSSVQELLKKAEELLDKRVLGKLKKLINKR